MRRLLLTVCLVLPMYLPAAVQLALPDLLNLELTGAGAADRTQLIAALLRDDEVLTAQVTEREELALLLQHKAYNWLRSNGYAAPAVTVDYPEAGPLQFVFKTAQRLRCGDIRIIGDTLIGDEELLKMLKQPRDDDSGLPVDSAREQDVKEAFWRNGTWVNVYKGHVAVLEEALKRWYWHHGYRDAWIAVRHEINKEAGTVDLVLDVRSTGNLRRLKHIEVHGLDAAAATAYEAWLREECAIDDDTLLSQALIDQVLDCTRASGRVLAVSAGAKHDMILQVTLKPGKFLTPFNEPLSEAERVLLTARNATMDEYLSGRRCLQLDMQFDKMNLSIVAGSDSGSIRWSAAHPETTGVVDGWLSFFETTLCLSLDNGRLRGRWPGLIGNMTLELAMRAPQEPDDEQGAFTFNTSLSSKKSGQAITLDVLFEHAALCHQFGRGHLKPLDETLHRWSVGEAGELVLDEETYAIRRMHVLEDGRLIVLALLPTREAMASVHEHLALDAAAIDNNAVAAAAVEAVDAYVHMLSADSAVQDHWYVMWLSALIRSGMVAELFVSTDAEDDPEKTALAFPALGKPDPQEMAQRSMQFLAMQGTSQIIAHLNEWYDADSWPMLIACGSHGFITRRGDWFMHSVTRLDDKRLGPLATLCLSRLFLWSPLNNSPRRQAYYRRMAAQGLQRLQLERFQSDMHELLPDSLILHAAAALRAFELDPQLLPAPHRAFVVALIQDLCELDGSGDTAAIKALRNRFSAYLWQQGVETLLRKALQHIVDPVTVP